MEIISVIAIIVPALVSVFHAYLSYKRSKDSNRDPIWDAALQITITQTNCCDVDTFASNYEQLAAFKANGCSLHGETTISRMVKASSRTESQSQAQSHR